MSRRGAAHSWRSRVAWPGCVAGPRPASTTDRLKELQTAYVANCRPEDGTRLSLRLAGAGRRLLEPHQPHQPPGPGLRLRPEGRPGAVTGENSRYRDAGEDQGTLRLPAREHGQPRADYADQSDLYRVQKEAVARGVKHLFIVWFDGLDWPTTQAAAIVKTGKVYTEGKGSGLIFQDYDAGGTAQYGFVVTSPTHDKNTPDVDAQTVVDPADSLGGGYDARIAGPNPWTLGPLGPKAPGYLKGQSANAADRAGVLAVGGVLHAYTDSSTERRRDGQRGQVVQQRGQRHRRRPARADPVSRAPGPGVEGRHGDQRAVRPRLARRDVRARRLSRRLPGPRPRRCSACPESSSRRGRTRSTPASTWSSARASGSPANREVAGGPGEERSAREACSSPTPISAAIDVKNGGKYVVVHTEPGPTAARRCSRPPTAAARALRAAVRLLRPRRARPSPLPDRRRPLRPRAQHRQQRQASPGRVVHPGRPRSSSRPSPR